MAGSDGRLTTVIGPERARRLKLTAVVLNKPIADVVTELLDLHLPSAAELASAIAGDDMKGTAA